MSKPAPAPKPTFALPPEPGLCSECGEPPIPVKGADGLLVPPLVDGLCFFCRVAPKLKRDALAPRDTLVAGADK